MEEYTKRITRRNPCPAPGAPTTYRIPMAVRERWREEVSVGAKVILGEVANKLGRYEDIGEPEEIEKKLKRLEEFERRENIESGSFNN